MDLPGVTPVALDVTDPVSVAAAVAATGGVSILVNNAGSSTGASLLTGDPADIRLEMDTHYFGTLTNALRLELAPGGTRVTALHIGYMDTDMTGHLDVPKSDPAGIAKLAIDGIEAGDAEVIADDVSSQVLARLSVGVAGLYPRWPKWATGRERRSGGIDIPGEPGDAPISLR